MTYTEKRLNLKNNYPFAHWEEDWYPLEPEEEGLDPADYGDDIVYKWREW